MRDVEDGDLVVGEGPWFDAFVNGYGATLRRALVAANGVQIGNDVYAEAIAWAWENRNKVMGMEHPVAYLFRVGQSAARRQRRWRREVRLVPESHVETSPTGSVRLEDALARLGGRQRTVVILVHAHGWPYAEVADVLGVSVASVRNQAHRGMKRLRERMGHRE